MQYKGYDVVVLVSPDASRSTFETTYAIYRGRARLFTGIAPLDVTSLEDGERVGYAAARRWIDQQR
jgi:hypothetical protein